MQQNGGPPVDIGPTTRASSTGTSSHGPTPSLSSSILPLYNDTTGQGSSSSLGLGQPPKTQSVILTRKRASSTRWRHSSGGHRSKSGDFRSSFSSGSWSDLLSTSRNPILAIFRPKYLTSRARTTNLAVLLLLLTLTLSLLYNIRFYLHEHPLSGERDRLPLSIKATLPQSNRLAVNKQGRRQLLGDSRKAGGEGKDSLDDSAFNADNVDLTRLEHLVMVPGHAVWKGRTKEEATQDENWVLEDIQKGGSVQTFIRHVMKGVELAVNDPSALLIFSGGQTRIAAQETEGDSYFRLAEALDLYSQYGTPKTPDGTNEGIKDEAKANERRPPQALDVGAAIEKGKNATDPNLTPQDLAPFARATTEQYALDSYQNLIFSLCRFKEMTGRYPTRVTVVGFGMKRSRFTDVHRAALRWPLGSFTYIGIDDAGETGQSYLGEKEFGLKPFLEDFYGCKGFLLAKRKKRNPFRRIHPYFTSNPLLREILEYCPNVGNTVYPKTLPWESVS